MPQFSLPAILAMAALAPLPAAAEQGVLVLQAKDIHGKPVTGVRFRAGASSDSDPTEKYGQARLQLPIGTRVGDPVILEIVSSPADLVLISPWDSWASVPPFDDKPSSFVAVVLAKRKDRAMLEDPDVLQSAVLQCNRATANNASKTAALPVNRGDESGGSSTSPAATADPLTEISNRYGLDRGELDVAIRKWGAEVHDPYKRGLAEDYAKEYQVAERDLSESLRQAEQEVTRARLKLAERAGSLAQTLYKEGKYLESAAKYREAVDNEPDERSYQIGYATALNSLGQSATAQSVLTGAISSMTGAADFKSPKCQVCLAAAYEQLAKSYQASNHPDDAEHAFLEEVKISQQLNEAHPGQYSIEVVKSLDQLAVFYLNLKELDRAEDRLAEALKIMGSTSEGLEQDPRLFLQLNESLGLIYTRSRRPEQASTLYESAASTLDQTMITAAPRTLNTARKLNVAGELHVDAGDSAGAIERFGKAVSILSKLQKDGSDLQVRGELQASWGELGDLHFDKHDYLKAERDYSMALAVIRELAQKDPFYVQRLIFILAGRGSAPPRGMVDTELLLNKGDAARQYYDELVNTYERSESIGTATQYNREQVMFASDFLGDFYRAAKRYEEALGPAREDLAASDRLGPGGRQSVATAQRDLADVYRGLRRFQEAEDLIAKDLSFWQELNLAPAVAMNRRCAGDIYYAEGRFVEAEVAYSEAISYWRTVHFNSPTDVRLRSFSEALRGAGILYQGKGRTKEAEMALNEARKYQEALVKDAKIMEITPWTDRSNLIETLGALAKLYSATGRVADADAALRELRAYSRQAPQ